MLSKTKEIFMTVVSQFIQDGVSYRVMRLPGSSEPQLFRQEVVVDRGRKAVKQRGRYKVVAGVPTVWRRVDSSVTSFKEVA